jgi:hypothetical protein
MATLHPGKVPCTYYTEGWGKGEGKGPVWTEQVTTTNDIFKASISSHITNPAITHYFYGQQVI